MITQPATNQPLGAVIAYMGYLDSRVELKDDDGSCWLLCDGSPISQSDYVGLYQTIGDAFGPPASGTFRLPDLQGQFVRVLDIDSSKKNVSSGRDDFTQRVRLSPATTPPTTPDASYIGSYQLDSVPHQHGLSGYAWALYDSILSHKSLMSNDDPLSVFGQTDASPNWAQPPSTETRPKNVFLNFLIRAKAGSASSQESSGLPLGAVLYFCQLGAPKTRNETWLPCDNTIDPPSRFSDNAMTVETPLFATLGTYFGPGNGNTTFDVPDLRGYFIRAVNGGSGNDPDVASRKRTTGLPLDAVGSTQTCAVAAHSHVIMNIWGTKTNGDGIGDKAKRNFADGNLEYATVGTVEQGRNSPSRSSGSDIRPYNTALTASLLATTSTQHLPIGSIVPYAGWAPPPQPSTGGNIWVICDGSLVTQASATYADLFYGLFNLGPNDPKPPVQVPDLRGRFVRGYDPAQKLDPDISSRAAMFHLLYYPPSGSANAITSVQPDAYNRHTHGLSSAHWFDHHGNGDECVTDDSGAGGFGGATDGVQASFLGGETRPANIYLQYIIRIA